MLFYYVYVVACGFKPRKHTIKRFPCGIIRTNEVVCSCQGYPKKQEGITISEPKLRNREPNKVKLSRIGCKARIKFRYHKHGYVVDTFYEGHNHNLTLVKYREFHVVARNISLYHKQTIVNNVKLNIGTSETFRICKEQCNGYENVGASKVDFDNFKRDMKCFIGCNDAQMFIDNMKSLVEMNKGFYFAYDLDSSQNIVRMFWADAESRRYYSVFGDGVSYDPTYGTNKYCMVFTPFTGVDNHKKSVCFGAALISNEDEKSFEWVFQKFLECMDGREPNIIITDQDPAIKNAFPKVFKTTSHRLCMWHITNKVNEKVGSVICRDTDFLNRLNSVIWNELLENDEFDQQWNEVIDEFSLHNNLWLTEMFGIRDQWIPAYFRGVPMGHLLRTTQRSESANSFFKKFESRYGTLVEFWMRFVSAMQQQRYTQKKLELDSKSTLPKNESGLLLESHGIKVYTHEAFYDFQQEIHYSSRSCSVAGFSKNGRNETTTVEDTLRHKMFQVNILSTHISSIF